MSFSLLKNNLRYYFSLNQKYHFITILQKVLSNLIIDFKMNYTIIFKQLTTNYVFVIIKYTLFI